MTTLEDYHVANVKYFFTIIMRYHDTSVFPSVHLFKQNLNYCKSMERYLITVFFFIILNHVTKMYNLNEVQILPTFEN